MEMKGMIISGSSAEVDASMSVNLEADISYISVFAGSLNGDAHRVLRFG
jgi:hypothetical protein